MDVLQIMTKIFEKIKKNGWKSVTGLSSEEESRLILSKGLLKSFIFNHSVAQAFFGEEEVCAYCGGMENGYSCSICSEEDYIKNWEWHLQRIVLEKEPLKYMEKFL